MVVRSSHRAMREWDRSPDVGSCQPSGTPRSRDVQPSPSSATSCPLRDRPMVSAQKLQPHCHPTGGTEPLFGLVSLDGSEFGPDFVISKHAESEVFVQGPVPWHLREGGQGKNSTAPTQRPYLRLLDERLADSASLVGGMHSDLLDMASSVQEDVADDISIVTHRHPGTAGLGVVVEHFDRIGRVVRHMVVPDDTELTVSCQLDRLEPRGVISERGPDRRHRQPGQ